MPFDPSKPGDGTLCDAFEMREQLTSLKALLDAQAAQVAALTAQVNALAASVAPVGGVILWHRDLTGVPALPANFVECNGQTLSDPFSPLDNQVIPNYNGEQRFPRAGSPSGQAGGSDTFGLMQADFANVGAPFNVVSPDSSPGASPIPPFATFVLVMRVK